MKKPVIGISSSYKYQKSTNEQSGNPLQEVHSLADEYVTAVIRAGGIPVIVPILDDLDIIRGILENVDGLILSGGEDIDPKYYKKRAVSEVSLIIPKRDKQDLFCAKYMVENTDKPLLGICRGAQVMNVALGGTLYQHLPASGFEQHSLINYPACEVSHYIQIEEDSLLYRITKSNIIGVNSYHHQAVETVAPSLRVVATSVEDNLCEAIELKDSSPNRFVLGVQWHPEKMACQAKVQQEIINAFVNSCKQ